MDPASFATVFNVPRGTIERLVTYERLLREAQTTQNLVSATTLLTLWSRHFADSAQLSRVVPSGLQWVDIGSGGGFPGLVLAAMEWGRFTLVESIAKKCRFQAAVADAMDVNDMATIVNGRVEDIAPIDCDVVTSRATADLGRLLTWGFRHGGSKALYVFPKGRRWEREIAPARQQFRFDFEAVPSMTDPEARIIVIRGLARR